MRHALALPARELVRVAEAEARARGRTSSSARAMRASALGRCRGSPAARPALRSTVWRGCSAAVRVLEHHLHVRLKAAAAGLRRRLARGVASCSAMRPAAIGASPDARSTRATCPSPDSPDEAEALAASATVKRLGRPATKSS
jgi:hypothetical protein